MGAHMDADAAGGGLAYYTTVQVPLCFSNTMQISKHKT